jgi:hypothetical protein
LLLLLSIIYTINLPVVRPRSCRVIYYFDTPALGRRHQSFGRVTLWIATVFPHIIFVLHLVFFV